MAWTGLDGWTVMNGILEFAFHNTVIQYLNTETYYKWQNPIRIDGSDQPPRLWYVLPPEAEPKGPTNAYRKVNHLNDDEGDDDDADDDDRP